VKTVLGQVDAKVERIVISDLKDDTFYAQIILRNGDEVFDVDSRPSDAIALALKLHSPIFAADSVLHDAGLKVNGDETPVIWEDSLEEVTGLGTEIDDFTVEADKEAGSHLAEVITNADALLAKEVVSLKEKLKEAVSKEDYEKAAEIRDELCRLDSPIEGL
jgi:hypothetical protein